MGSANSSEARTPGGGELKKKALEEDCRPHGDDRQPRPGQSLLRQPVQLVLRAVGGLADAHLRDSHLRHVHESLDAVGGAPPQRCSGICEAIAVVMDEKVGVVASVTGATSDDLLAPVQRTLLLPLVSQSHAEARVLDALTPLAARHLEAGFAIEFTRLQHPDLGRRERDRMVNAAFHGFAGRRRFGP